MKTAMRKQKTISMAEAIRIGRKMGVRGIDVCRDELDQKLWCVIARGRMQAHAPMCRADWVALMTEWKD